MKKKEREKKKTRKKKDAKKKKNREEGKKETHRGRAHDPLAHKLRRRQQHGKDQVLDRGLPADRRGAVDQREEPRGAGAGLLRGDRGRAGEGGDPEPPLGQEAVVGGVGEGAVEADPDGEGDEGREAPGEGVDAGLKGLGKRVERES